MTGSPMPINCTLGDGRDVAPGEVGEIIVSGPKIAQGY